jgi:hypothetical protein
MKTPFYLTRAKNAKKQGQAAKPPPARSFSDSPAFPIRHDSLYADPFYPKNPGLLTKAPVTLLYPVATFFPVCDCFF